MAVNDPRVRHTQPRQPVERETVEAVLPILPPTVAAMVELQWLTGMRPEEVRIMRARDIDRSDDDCWLYRPGSHLPFGQHKNAWRGHERVIPLGPKCQTILRPRLEDTAPDAYLFPPEGKVEPYTDMTYSQTVRRACKRADTRQSVGWSALLGPVAPKAT